MKPDDRVIHVKISPGTPIHGMIEEAASEANCSLTKAARVLIRMGYAGFVKATYNRRHK